MEVTTATTNANLRPHEELLDFPTFLQMCLPGADKIFDFLPLSTFLSLRQISQEMKDIVDSSYRFYCHLKSHVIWMKTHEELKSMRDKLQELVEQDEYSLIESIQFGLELNEYTVHTYSELASEMLIRKITHLRISKSINEAFDENEDEVYTLRENIQWLAEFETFLRQSNLVCTLRSLEIDELAFNNCQKFHQFLMNISNIRKSPRKPSSSVPEEEEGSLHPLSIKIGSLKTTNAYTSYFSASGQKGTSLNVFQSKERIESLLSSNLRVSLTLRQLADFANEHSNTPDQLKLLSSVENIVDLESFPSTRQMEMLPLVPLENCKFENVTGLIIVLPQPSTDPKNKNKLPKLSPFYEYLYFAKGAWPHLGKRIVHLTVQSAESSEGTEQISRQSRDDDSLLPVIKLHAEGIQKSFPNLKRFQIWGNLSVDEWNAWWIAIKPLRNLWSLSIKARGPVMLDEVFLPSSSKYKVPPFLNIPALDCIQIYSSGVSRRDGFVSITDAVFTEVFSRMKIRSLHIVERGKTNVTARGLQALADGTFGKTVLWFRFELAFAGDFADTHVALTNLKLLCKKNMAAQNESGHFPNSPYYDNNNGDTNELSSPMSHPILELPGAGKPHQQDGN